MSSLRTNVNRGFTLIELLVVLCAIALVVSVLLCAVPDTRRQAQTAVCASRLGEIAIGMTNYAQLYDGAIAGSPITSGGHMFYMAEPISPSESDTMQLWDYAGPIRRVLTGSVQVRNVNSLQPWPPLLVQKFATYRTGRRFLCPENDYTAFAFDPAYDVGIGRMLSYNTSRNFMWLGHSAPSPHEGSLHWPTGHSGSGFGRVPSHYGTQPPDDYEPFLHRVGPPATKVFIADGGRYTALYQLTPDYDADPFASYGGAFADEAPYTDITHSWNRMCSPGARPDVFRQLICDNYLDFRLYAYRHGNRVPCEADFMMNAAFYDGHVELMTDWESANPHMWIPTGGTLERDAHIFDDVSAEYFGNLTVIDIQ